jgi:putative oxidoreductase
MESRRIAICLLGSNILFFAAWPMLGACFTLYYLRDLDTLWSVRDKKS